MKKSILMLISGVSLFASVPAYAATHQFSAEVENTITTGDISIAIEEYELDCDQNLIPYQDGKTILPGQSVAKIICITNEAEPSWIRAKAEFMSRSGIDELDDGMLGGISDTWIKRGDYYYYTKPVDTGEVIRFFEEVMIPSNWDEAYSEKGFFIDITAQAIQQVNFQPLFRSEDPWFGIPIEECVHSDHELHYSNKNTEFSIIFENGVDGFIKIENDFFQNFSAMMPGDTLTDSFLVGNHFSKMLSIKFRTEVPDEQSKESLKLLSDLILTINRGSEVLYQGPLHAERLRDGIEIVNALKQNEAETFTYTIYMPKELQNAAAMQHARVRWIFYTEYAASSGGGGGGSHTSAGGNSEKREKTMSTVALDDPAAEIPEAVPVADNTGQVIRSIFPKTGDNSMEICDLLIVMLISGVGSFALFALWFLKRKHDSQKQSPVKEDSNER